jgi:hypothetical protein
MANIEMVADKIAAGAPKQNNATILNPELKEITGPLGNRIAIISKMMNIKVIKTMGVQTTGSKWILVCQSSSNATTAKAKMYIRTDFFIFMTPHNAPKRAATTLFKLFDSLLHNPSIYQRQCADAPKSKTTTKPKRAINFNINLFLLYLSLNLINCNYNR